MGAVTSIVMMGAAIASGVASYASSRTQAARAEDQAEIGARQGELELSRSAQSAEQAMLELEDAKEYQQWKTDFVVPALDKAISNPIQDDPAQIQAKANLARGIQVEQAQDVVGQGITGAGLDFGGNRMQAANQEIAGAVAGASVATAAASHDQVRQQGIANTGNLIQAGRSVYKQQGIV